MTTNLKKTAGSRKDKKSRAEKTLGLREFYKTY
jgi:hypothetical protein